ncbi:hypothetical protein AAK967_00610 [Atopobiaceae bacterium 24-176]
MARGVRLEFNPAGFQAVVGSAGPLVEAEAETLAARAGDGAEARPTRLTRFRGGPRPGAVVAATGSTARDVAAANERLDRSLP